MNKERFRLFAHILIYYTILVILWGAWVRISHSGDGCGNSWPKCQGEFIPDLATKKTFTEYFHRLMSGFYGIWVFLLFLFSRYLYSPASIVRRTATLTLVFMIIEALLGAKLVLFNLVGDNDSFFRAFTMSLHQINSLLLTGSIFLLFKATNENLIFKNKDFLKWPFLFVLLISISGAWAALSTTLFPSQGLWEGLLNDFQADSHFLVQLRVLHPILGLLLGGGLAIYFYRISLDKAPRLTSLIITTTVLIGIMTLLLKSPLFLKLSHLLFVHLSWIALLNYAVISLDSNKR